MIKLRKGNFAGYKCITASIFLYLIFLGTLHAQVQSADELFTLARTAAFDDKDYTKAIGLAQQALEQSPDYTEIRVFLGRLYTWADQVVLAQQTFEGILADVPDDEDASLAFGNLEYWNANSPKALEIVDAGLAHHPESEPLLLLKVKILSDLRAYDRAADTNRKLLELYPTNSEALALQVRLTVLAAKNQVGVTYDFVSFDKRYKDPWHLVAFSYTRQTELGSVVGRINYANRFKTGGAQVEADAYPSISKTFYAYVNAGYSADNAIFPKYRAGASLYANLRWAMEAEAGFRLLGFDNETWIYTASVGKYYKKFWFNLRTFLTPSNNSVSQSVSLTTRYYLGEADDYVNLRIGTGLSPDNQANNILYNNGNPYKLKSNNIALGYRKLLWKTSVAFIEAAWENQEYLPNEKGNQFTIGVGYLKRF